MDSHHMGCVCANFSIDSDRPAGTLFEKKLKNIRREICCRLFFGTTLATRISFASRRNIAFTVVGSFLIGKSRSRIGNHFLFDVVVAPKIVSIMA
jgi:hypothetical protein